MSCCTKSVTSVTFDVHADALEVGTTIREPGTPFRDEVVTGSPVGAPQIEPMFPAGSRPSMRAASTAEVATLAADMDQMRERHASDAGAFCDGRTESENR